MKKFFTIIIFLISLVPSIALGQLQSDKPIPLQNSILAILDYLEKTYPQISGLGYASCANEYSPGFSIAVPTDSKKCERLEFDCSSLNNIKLLKKKPLTSGTEHTGVFTISEIREIFFLTIQQLPAYYRDKVINSKITGYPIKNGADSLTESDNRTIALFVQDKLRPLNCFGISWKDGSKNILEVSTGRTNCNLGHGGPLFYLQKINNKWTIIETKFWAS